MQIEVCDARALLALVLSHVPLLEGEIRKLDTGDSMTCKLSSPRKRRCVTTPAPGPTWVAAGSGLEPHDPPRAQQVPHGGYHQHVVRWAHDVLDGGNQVI